MMEKISFVIISISVPSISADLAALMYTLTSVLVL